eukprot:1143850-Pelagomonas_calceolata.AAC.1
MAIHPHKTQILDYYNKNCPMTTPKCLMTSAHQHMLIAMCVCVCQISVSKAAVECNVFHRWGDALYDKGEFDLAMAAYKETLHHLEPSYVLRRFLDAQRIHNLTSYLELLHEKQPTCYQDSSLNCSITTVKCNTGIGKRRSHHTAPQLLHQAQRCGQAGRLHFEKMHGCSPITRHCPGKGGPKNSYSAAGCPRLWILTMVCKEKRQPKLLEKTTRAPGHEASCIALSLGPDWQAQIDACVDNRAWRCTARSSIARRSDHAGFWPGCASQGCVQYGHTSLQRTS